MMNSRYVALFWLVAANLLGGTADENWQTFPIPNGLNGEVVRLLAFGDFLYAAGNFTEADGQEAGGIAAWDGAHWSAVGRGLNGSVLALASDGTNLYAGGHFVIPELAITNLAMWSGDRWQRVGNVT